MKGFGDTSTMFLKIAEFLVINGHDRNEVYDYSIKKLFYFFDVVSRHKNKDLFDKAIADFNVMVSINSGEIKHFKEFIDKLEI